MHSQGISAQQSGERRRKLILVSVGDTRLGRGHAWVLAPAVKVGRKYRVSCEVLDQLSRAINTR